eukprot:3202167-Rhodomonas_salina.1
MLRARKLHTNGFPTGRRHGAGTKSVFYRCQRLPTFPNAGCANGPNAVRQGRGQVPNVGVQLRIDIDKRARGWWGTDFTPLQAPTQSTQY